MASVMSLSEPLALRTHWKVNTPRFVVPLPSAMPEFPAVSICPTSAVPVIVGCPVAAEFVSAAACPVATSLQLDFRPSSYLARTLTL